MPAPHRMVDRIMDGVADGASGAVRSLTGGVKQVGNQLMNGLDAPCRELTGKEGPHRIVDHALDGYVDAVENGICQGAIGSMKIVGEGISRGLDNPVEQIGIPPADIGKISPRM